MSKQTIAGVTIESFSSLGHVACLVGGFTDAMLKTYAEMIGENPSFKRWEEARMEWVTGYAEQAGENVKQNTINKAWSRFAADLNSEYSLTKPASDKPDAVKKAKQQETKESAAQAAYKAAGLPEAPTMEQLKVAATDALEKGDAASLKVLTASMDKIARETAREQAKAAKAAEQAKQPSAIIKRLRAKLDGMTVENLLALETLLDQFTPEELLTMARGEEVAAA